jgi:hypothetical protein
MRGVAGYGRYDDDQVHVGCPWAKSDMSPCVARDGHLALGGEPPRQCVGCGNDVPYLIRDLADDYQPARVPAPALENPREAADRFRRLVWEATKPAEEVRDGQSG